MLCRKPNLNTSRAVAVAAIATGCRSLAVGAWALALAILAGSLILGSGDALAKTKSCADGDVLKWSDATGDWVCAEDKQSENDDVIWQLTTNIVFVTREEFTGDLGGVAGADAKCTDAARDAGLIGNYKAWISTSTYSPATHFAHSGRPYYLVDGVTKVADHWDDLTDDSLGAPINKEADGTAAVGVFVWTATTGGGFYDDTLLVKVCGTCSCDDWTNSSFDGFLGDVSSHDETWTDLNASTRCSVPQRLYCFSQ